MAGRSHWIWLLSAAACALAPDAVSACGPCVCDGENGVQVFPRFSQDLPQNAVLHVWAPKHKASDFLLLRGEPGTMTRTEVEIETQSIAPDVFEVRARELLEAGASYSLDIAGAGNFFGTYQVRAGQDTTPPTVEDAVAADPRDVLAGHCGRKRAAAIELSGVEDDDESESRRVVRIDIDGVDRPLFMITEYGGTTVAIGRERETGTFAPCLGAVELGEDAPAGSFSAQVSVLDYAGNASEPRKVHGLKLSDVAAADCGESGGCNAAPGRGTHAGAAWVVACSFIALGVTRRRRTDCQGRA